jgi:hypothetical protein
MPHKFQRGKRAAIYTKVNLTDSITFLTCPLDAQAGISTIDLRPN